MSNTSFNVKSIVELRDKLKFGQINPTNEESTKQWLVIPMLVGLGYNPYSSDIIPEYTADIGIKRGERVDYAIQINGQPVIFMECKQLNVSLQSKHIDQLYRYFNASDIFIAILTNGDDYWFFTDSMKDNIMDTEPYLKFKLSDASIEDIKKLSLYSKELIQELDVKRHVRCKRFEFECKQLAYGLKNNKVPDYLLDILIERSGDIDIDRDSLAEYVHNIVTDQFDGYRKIKNDVQSKKLNNQKEKTHRKNKDKKSNIRLNHEYVFNDYSDGDWQFHKIGYAIIDGKRFDDISGRQLLIEVAKHAMMKLGGSDIFICSGLFNGNMGIIQGKQEDTSVYGYIDEYDASIKVKFGIGNIVRFISKILDFANIPYMNVRISFKD